MRRLIRRIRFAWLLLLLSSISLTASIPPEVVAALNEAGSNRALLEGVLKHYQRDAEKRKAACFLIAHMPLHKNVAVAPKTDPQLMARCREVLKKFETETLNLSDKEFADKDKALKAWRKEMRKTNEAEQWHVFAENRRALPDIQTIDSAFLIRHIEQAFKIRSASPLARKLTLSEFFEYVLPYRAWNDSPFVYPGDEYAALFGPILMAHETDDVRLIVKRYNRAVSHLRNAFGRYPFSHAIGLYELCFTGVHGCVETTDFAVNVLRACGVPAMPVRISTNRFFAPYHTLVAVLNKDGRWCPFDAEGSLPNDRPQFKDGLNLFFDCFSRQNDNPATLCGDTEPVPEQVASPCLKDVTRLMVGTCKLTLPVSAPGRKLAYLASFNSRARGGLYVVTWGKVDAGTATFEYVRPDNLYFPVYAESSDKLKGFGSPFMLVADSTQQCGYRLEPVGNKVGVSKQVWLQRKFPVKPNMFHLAQRARGTVVLASDDKTFKQADTLARIDFVPLNDWQDIALPARKAYRYYRIAAPKNDPHMYISEAEWLVDRRRGYTNVVPPRHMVPGYNKAKDENRWQRLLAEPWEKTLTRKISDGDVTTALEAYPNANFFLQEPQVIDRLRFTIKNANNGINYGDIYRLYEWRDGAWQLLRTALAVEGDWRPFSLVTNRLYWLRDMTKGTEEMPFIIDSDGKQCFLMQSVYYDAK